MLWLAGFLGLEGWPSLVALVISGFGITLELTLIMALPPCLERGEAVASLTAGMSFVGYAMAFVMPMIGGWLAEAFANENLALWPMLPFAALSLIAVYRMPLDMETEMTNNDGRTGVSQAQDIESARL
ncbi:hypothetical protein [Salinicola sp. CPA57]|uniref:hypothetical protein n=1 Tax=Salinicola sp. CPA57 TaxID=1949080 RepID=UPI000DA25F07|nr:hypothetical protein [Salinicola sp. CPA57]